MQQQIDFGDPCKRCGRPMYPQHVDPEPGYVRHWGFGFCDACRRALQRQTQPARQMLFADDGIVDEIAVERAAKGDRAVRATTPELWAAVLQLRTLTYSDYDIAFILGMPLAWVRGGTIIIERGAVAA